MDAEDLKKIEDIEERWKVHEDTSTFCERCVYEAIRHWDRNMPPSCENYDHDFPCPHTMAKSADTVWTLLNIIRKLYPKSSDQS